MSDPGSRRRPQPRPAPSGRYPDPRSAARAFLLATGLSLASIAVVNFVVNPLGYWNHHLGNFPQVIPQDIEDKLPLLAAMHPRAQCLILGSSHVLMIEPEYVDARTGLPTFNWGINGAPVETQYAVLSRSLEDDLVDLRLLIIGADVGGFVGELDHRLPRCALVREHMPFKVTPKLHEALSEELLEGLFGWSTLRRSLKSMKRKWQAPGNVRPLHRTFGPNGQIRYPDWEHQKAKGTYDRSRLIAEDMDEYPPRYRFDHIDPRRAQWLEDMVRMAQERGAKVVCFPTPLHPELDAYVRETSNYSALLDQVRELLADLDARYDNMTWTDCSTIDKFGGRADWYWDGAHPSVENTRLIVDKCLEALDVAVQ